MKHLYTSRYIIYRALQQPTPRLLTPLFEDTGRRQGMPTALTFSTSSIFTICASISPRRSDSSSRKKSSSSPHCSIASVQSMTSENSPVAGDAMVMKMGPRNLSAWGGRRSLRRGRLCWLVLCVVRGAGNLEKRKCLILHSRAPPNSEGVFISVVK